MFLFILLLGRDATGVAWSASTYRNVHEAICASTVSKATQSLGPETWSR